MIPHRSFQIEIASSRSEIYEKVLEVHLKWVASLEEDLKRRDLRLMQWQWIFTLIIW